MVVDTEDTDLLFHALADATRRDIVRRALDGSHSITDLAEAYPMSFAAVQKHVAVLERAGMVTKERHGRERRVRTEIEAIRLVQHLLDDFEAVWRARVGRMDEILDDEEGA